MNMLFYCRQQFILIHLYALSLKSPSNHKPITYIQIVHLTLKKNFLIVENENVTSYIHSIMKIRSAGMKTGLIPPNSKITIEVPVDTEPCRVDSFLGDYFTAYSRSYFHKLIADERITVNGKTVKKPSLHIQPADSITIEFPPELEFYTTKEIPELEVTIIHTDPDFLVVSKPAHLTVHVPSIGSKEITLVDWLLSKFKELKQVGREDRPGIVHRLDKDTSGILIIPRNNYAHEQFGNMFKNRQIHKTYIAVVKGHPEKKGTIESSIARHPNVPIKMTHGMAHGKEAITHYKVLEYFPDAALVELKPVTGRTHQLRVHCAAIGHPILGDTVYGTKSKLINRQALHAQKISFDFGGNHYEFEANPPHDFEELLKTLRDQSRAQSEKST